MSLLDHNSIHTAVFHSAFSLRLVFAQAAALSLRFARSSDLLYACFVLASAVLLAPSSGLGPIMVTYWCAVPVHLVHPPIRACP